MFRTYLIGPRNPKARADLRVEISFRADPEARRMVVLSEGSPKEVAVKQNGWSEWLRVKFKLGLLQSIRGMVRFHLVSIRTRARGLRLSGELRSRLALFPDQRSSGVSPEIWRRGSAFITRPGWSRIMRG